MLPPATAKVLLRYFENSTLTSSETSASNVLCVVMTLTSLSGWVWEFSS